LEFGIVTAAYSFTLDARQQPASSGPSIFLGLRAGNYPVTYMRREPATVLAALISILPGFVVAALGDPAAQYGMLIVLVALPFYCMFVAAVLAVVPMLVGKCGYRSMRAYLWSGCISSFLLGVTLVKAEAGWFGATAGAVCLLSAFVLVPILERIGTTGATR
jgi:hypothetical protein